MENTNPQSFTDVKVFAGDNFYPASDATFNNLIWEQDKGKGKNIDKVQPCYDNHSYNHLNFS